MTALELSNISKSFDGFQALSSASLQVANGEVHALLGENGAGKSSLMNVAAGLYRPDSGVIRIAGREVSIDGPAAARRLGVGMVHQHYKLVKAFSALENIKLAIGARNEIELMRHIRERAASLGFEVDLRRPVGGLSVAEQQRIEILKVLLGGAGIVILDEPSAVLTDKEAASLLSTMRQVAAQGTAVVLVTHKLNEVKRYADKVTIMRGGRTIATADPQAPSVGELTAMVVGQLEMEAHSRTTIAGTPILTLSGVAAKRADGHQTLANASLTLRRGEIYGIAGVGGNGQAELGEVLMGVIKPSAGRLELDGKDDVTGDNAERRRQRGFATIPADRHSYGLAGDLSIVENHCIRAVRAGRLGGWLRVDRRRAHSQARLAIAAFDVQGVRSMHQKASLLSGGNAQKLVISREFEEVPHIVVAASPSRGLDARATGAVHRRLREARDAGAGVLLISEDLDEILLLSVRIGVINSGRIVREFDAPADRQAIGAAMVGHD